MYVFVLNKNKTASIPINSVEARLLLKNDKAKIYLKSPFVIQLYYNILNTNRIIFNVNVFNGGIEFIIISSDGNIYYIEKIPFLNDGNIIKALEGTFSFIERFVPFSEVYFMINSDALFHIDVKNLKSHKFINNSYDIYNLRHKKCLQCSRPIYKEQTKFYKVIKEFNFSGNSIPLCGGCYRNIKLEKYINEINILYNICNDLFNYIFLKLGGNYEK